MKTIEAELKHEKGKVEIGLEKLKQATKHHNDFINLQVYKKKQEKAEKADQDKKLKESFEADDDSMFTDDVMGKIDQSETDITIEDMVDDDETEKKE